MTTYYDVVVVGDELAGAVAAVLLSRRGYRVLMVCSRPSETDQLAGHALPRQPLVLAGLEGSTFKHLSQELNLVQVLRRRVTANQPAYQAILPDHRIDVGPDLVRELARELPDSIGMLEAWLNAAEPINKVLDTVLGKSVLLPPDGFWDRRDLGRIAAQLPSEDAMAAGPLPPGTPFHALISSPVCFASHLAEPGLCAHARLGEQHRHGTWSVAGGREGLRALLLERFQAVSGELRHETVRGLITRRGRVVGVAVGTSSQDVGCELVIAASPAAPTLALYPDTAPRALRQAAAQAPALKRYLLHLVVALAGLPDPLGRLAYIIRDPASRLAQDNALMLHLSESHDQRATLTITALTHDSSPGGLGRLRRSILRTLDELFPFLDRHVVARWSPHEETPPEGDVAKQATVTPPLQPMEPLWGATQPPLGICGLPYRVGIRGLLCVSRQTLPGCGLEGELAAGWNVTRLVIERHKRRMVDKERLLLRL